MNSGAPFLNSHDAWSLEAVLGVVVDRSARIANGQDTAMIRCSERADVEPVFRDVAGGKNCNVSVAYRVRRFEMTKRDGAPEPWRAVDWKSLEISAVAIGADPGARVRFYAARATSLKICTLNRNANPTPKAPIPDDIQPEATANAPAPITSTDDPVQPSSLANAPALAAPNAEAIWNRSSGDWNTVFKRFRRWVKVDAFYLMFRVLAEDSDFEYVMIDGTIVKVHRHEQGAKGSLKARQSAALGAA